MFKLDLARRLRSTRVRAALGLGVVLAIGSTGTFAFWTDDVSITGTTFTTGTLDLNVNSQDPTASATLTMANTMMVPGASTAEVFTLNNAGTVPLKWTLVGGLNSGADATALASSLKVLVVPGGTRSVSGTSATCSGTPLNVGGTVLTTSATGAIIATRQGPVNATTNTTVCLQITFDANAAQGLAGGKVAGAIFTFTGTSDVS